MDAVIRAAGPSGERNDDGAAAPSCRGPWLFEDARFPEPVVQDAVELAVVLEEATRQVLEVPEEVRADVMAAHSPDVVADLEAEPLGEEPLSGVRVDRADHVAAAVAAADTSAVGRGAHGDRFLKVA
ncbi:hypothetical protein [Streptomyces sp. NPDC020480]|uniref:hypothetical protein n=1 Tax=Streptomyces sp. NPDC020480 TaxID=3365076 RepID=UPI0037B90FE2